MLVLEEAPSPDKRTGVFWKCLCDCGKEFIAAGFKLHRRKSCGCHIGPVMVDQKKTGLKKCWGRCRENKPLSEFYNNKAKADGLTAECKDCAKKACKQWRLNNRDKADSADDLKKKYGINLDQKKQMLASQGGRCAGCGTTEPIGVYKWCVDHNHKSNKIRGILCADCNKTIGNAREDVFRLLGLVQYLVKHNG